MAKSNRFEQQADVRVFQGSFPVETLNMTLKTQVEEGDVVALDTSGNLGKYDGATYTDVYGVSYETIEAPGEAVIILTGGLVKGFLKFGSNEKKLVVALRKVGIFVK